MRTILISLDSLNRHMLQLYGVADGMAMPRLSALAREGVTFDSHFTGSAPCMPARREFLTGRLELMHRGWGPLEPFDRTLSRRLRDEAQCPTMLITDHYHLFEHGGENYACDFTGYEFIRGHEHDNWKSHPVPMPTLNPRSHSDLYQERNRATFRDRADYPCARTFAAACRWAAENRDNPDFFLFIDEFDPHEPFFVPPAYLEQEDDSGYDGPRLEWPNYGHWQGSDQELAHIRARYRAKCRFLDDLLGELIDTLQAHGLYDDTTILVTTDHGHYLGEHGLIGKPAGNNWNTLFHIPLVVKPAASLGCPVGRHVAGLTTTPDIPATILDLHGLQLAPHLYGRSFLPLLHGSAERTRDYVLYGYYGDQLGYCDGEYTYFRASDPAAPLYYYTTQLSSHPGWNDRLRQWFRDAATREIGPFIPGEDYPVLRFPVPQPPVRGQLATDSDLLYAFPSDLAQTTPITDPDRAAAYAARLRAAMEAQHFPAELYRRYRLT